MNQFRFSFGFTTLILLSISLFISYGQVTSIATSNTQAVIWYNAPDTSACAIDVSESATYSPVVYDVDGTLFALANLDTSRLLMTGPLTTKRVIRIGKRNSDIATNNRAYSRALGVDTTYYYRITCTGPTIYTGRFHTKTLEGLAPDTPPINTNMWGRLGYPEFDWSDITKPIIDPNTGLRIWTQDTSDYSVKRTAAFSTKLDGGTGWANLSNLVTWLSAGAVSNTTNIVILHPNLTQLDTANPNYGGYYPYYDWLDFGVQINGQSSVGSGEDAKIQIALSLDGGQTPFTDWLDVVLPASTTTITIPNTTQGQLASFPAPYFRGWGSYKIPLQNQWTKGAGSAVNTSGSTVTLTGVSGFEGDNAILFDLKWPTGTRIYISGSGCDANDVCTISSVQDQLHLTTVETLPTLAGVRYYSFATCVMLRKKTAIGTVTLSAQYQAAIGVAHDNSIGGCSDVPVTSSDGITGYACIWPSMRAGRGGLYFFGTSQPVIRLVSTLRIPISATGQNLPGMTVADSPNCVATGWNCLAPSQPSFKESDPSYIYVIGSSQGGPLAMYQVHYTGGWTALPDSTKYLTGEIGNTPIQGETTWTNLTPACPDYPTCSLPSRTMTAQINSNVTWDTANWGSINTGLVYDGTNGNQAVFHRLYGGQDLGGWIFVFNTVNGNFISAFETTTGNPGGIRYAGIHAFGPFNGGTWMSGSLHELRASGSTVWNAGQYSVPIDKVLLADGVTWRGVGEANTSTAVPGVLPNGDGSYYATCPADLPQQYQLNGATGSHCLTVQVRDACRTSPPAAEIAKEPCAWDVTKSGIPLIEGDWLKDNSLGGDGEGFWIVRRTDLGSGVLQLILQRNANYSYCAWNDGTKDPWGAFDSLAQMTHSTGWSAYATSGVQSCVGNNIAIDILNSSSIYPINNNLLRGHAESRMTSIVNVDNWGGSGFGSALRPISISEERINLLGPFDHTTIEFPNFGGFNSGGMETQSYFKFTTATQFGVDFHHFNGGSGNDIERVAPSGGSVNPILESGTNNVYKISFVGGASGASLKKMISQVWSGTDVYSEKSLASIGDTLTDSDVGSFCTARVDGQCRSSSVTGNHYISIPQLFPLSTWTAISNSHGGGTTPCLDSQVSHNVICAGNGPTQGGKMIEETYTVQNSTGVNYRYLGTGLMTFGAQYVYSNIVPTPDSKYGIITIYNLHGYHNGLGMIELPRRSFSRPGNEWIPVKVSGITGSGVGAYVRFGYEEFGNPLSNQFYCLPRQEECQVATSTIVNANPFYWSGESYSMLVGSGSITIPALPGHILYYQIVNNGVPGPLQITIP